MNPELDAIVFMKFGYHELENEHDIILRNQNEFLNTGKMFRGYGWTICHPLNQIQPFVKQMREQGKKVFLAMAFTPSKPGMEAEESKLYSADNINWIEIPNQIRVTGSKYAIVCAELQRTDIKINLCNYKVAIWPSQGKLGSEYIAYRIDKWCLLKDREEKADQETHIQLIAEIVEPFAVMLK